MKKFFTLIGALLLTCLVHAQSETDTKDANKPNLQKKEASNQLETPKTVVELPEAVLRLHDLEKREYKGNIIYTHIPLELAKIKNPVKTV
ncbi:MULTISPECIES: hypothetical protein [unclassified Leeuwenhoekiella]|uniref:hypothetical protein n=1 Tax=unclassified Leeuwenhoekiella TaxID=2615029 RepID=UPI000C39C1E9|nr:MULTISPECIES: hypothetical protein [unclassified Leeuwenhoekiella]MAW93856.1 hypothetical protein [Leeuwenhoekiella sp.]MBA82263.1 hypothetical protein [Leeuwenhoekiella sp.]|tara:strand:+ start:7842 stop:8111 length:270 start_codon:yes stop_codon:yes gene_type:complete